MVDLFEFRRDGIKLTVREIQWIVKNVVAKMMMVTDLVRVTAGTGSRTHVAARVVPTW